MLQHFTHRQALTQRWLVKERDMLKYLVVALCLMGSCQLAAKETEHRELGAHGHGHGKANIAIEGDNLLIEIEAPGDDIVGLEHVVKSAADEEKVKTAKVTLSDSLNVVTLLAAAGCRQVSAETELHGGDATGGHSEHHTSYAFKCTRIAALKWIAFVYFKTFSNAKELDVAVAAPKGQKKFEVDPTKSRIDISGLI
jgi:hypothetical protein